MTPGNGFYSTQGAEEAGAGELRPHLYVVGTGDELQENNQF